MGLNNEDIKWLEGFGIPVGKGEEEQSTSPLANPDEAITTCEECPCRGLADCGYDKCGAYANRLKPISEASPIREKDGRCHAHCQVGCQYKSWGRCWSEEHCDAQYIRDKPAEGN